MYSSTAFLKISSLSYEVSTGNCIKTLHLALGLRFQLMIRELESDPLLKDAFSKVGTHVATVSNKVTF